eukprot:gene24896-45804_t
MALMVARQFESFNRMSTFVVHDLKNLVAQLSLLIPNAHKHRNNPEFQQDMLDTVTHSVQKMKLMLQKLSRNDAPARPAPLFIDQLLQQAVSLKAAFEPRPFQQIFDLLTAERAGICAVARLGEESLRGFVWGFEVKTQTGGCADNQPDLTIRVREYATRAHRDQAAHELPAGRALVLGRWAIELDGADEQLRAGLVELGAARGVRAGRLLVSAVLAGAVIVHPHPPVSARAPAALTLDLAATAARPAVRLEVVADRPGGLVFPLSPTPRCDILDNFGDARSGGRAHEGVDILATL